MNEEERNDKKRDESLLDKLGKGVKKNNKSKKGKSENEKK